MSPEGTLKVMRIIGWISIVVGIAMTILGVIGVIVWGSAQAMWIFLGGMGLAFGIVFVWVNRTSADAFAGLAEMLGQVSVEDGISGTGLVLSVRDTGITINELNAVFAVRVLAQAPGLSTYEAELSVTLDRAQWGTIQPGMSLPIMIDPDDHSRISYDQTRPAQTLVPGISPIGAAAGQQGTHHTYADMVAHGVRSAAVLQTVVPTGMTAGQVIAGLAPNEADDPLVQVEMVYGGPSGAQLRASSVMRVPDGKAGYVVVGATLPVLYLPESPDVATIDWNRL